MVTLSIKSDILSAKWDYKIKYSQEILPACLKWLNTTT